MRLLAWLSIGTVAGGALSDRDATVDFAADVRPLLSDRCFTCHGPGVADPAGGLRLDLADEAVDPDGFSAIVPGDSDASELVRRLAHEDPERRMPPARSKLELTDEEKDLLRRWIDQGATYGEHWSFVRPERSAPPDVRAEDWVRDDLDRFVLARLESLGIAPAPEADPATLLRRASLDLTGLPPTVDELRSFLADETPDRFERAVDRMLASTAHAEHMTALWLDVARYADTFGYQADVDMNVWPWRDWVIGAFERDLRYDEFLTQQLAGDLLPDATHDTRLATAFNRLHRMTNEGGSVEEEFRVESVADRVETMAGAFLGLTVGCARCHDHKFDPISQRDYFGLFAFFDGIDESGLYSHFTTSVPTPALDLPTEEQAAKLAEAQAKVDALEAQIGDEPAPLSTLFEADFTSIGTKGAVLRAIADPEIVEDEEDVPFVRLDGENGVAAHSVGEFRRGQPFEIELSIRVPRTFERAVVLHRSRAWTDAGSRGYQLLIEDGRLSFALVNFWPGDAIAIHAVEPVAVGRWIDVVMGYDGSSRVEGLSLTVDGERIATEVVRDELTRTIQSGMGEQLTIGSRFRDRGFPGGEVRSLVVRGLSQTATGVHVDLQRARKNRDYLRQRIPQIMTMREAGPPVPERVAYLLGRGLYSERLEPVEPATPASLPAFTDEAPASRLDLARWLTHPDHPLTARVHVDRLWRVAFGRGLVPSADDLGSQSRPPRHQELLDTLARDLIESGWDGRALLRRLVLSATYRQSSAASEESRRMDPDGEHLSRALRTRHVAETIRDALLRAAGRLSRTTGGPPVLPYQPPGLWAETASKTYTPSEGEGLRRRSVYTFWRRTLPPPTMTLFDAPSREVCRVARPATTTPLQALALWNDPQFVDAAVALARVAIESAGADDAARVRYLVEALASRDPSEAELEAMSALLQAQRGIYAQDPGEARMLAEYDIERVAHPGKAAGESEAAAKDDQVLDDATAVEVAATAVVASALFGLDEVVARR
ncbi:MAG: DUF1553 domain-containing protein [Planctomycetota bacterium]